MKHFFNVDNFIPCTFIIVRPNLLFIYLIYLFMSYYFYPNVEIFCAPKSKDFKSQTLDQLFYSGQSTNGRITFYQAIVFCFLPLY
jgi:hypothetical protein